MQVHFYVEKVQIGRVHITHVAHVQEPRLHVQTGSGLYSNNHSCGNQHRLCYHYIIESSIHQCHTHKPVVCISVFTYWSIS